MLRAEDLDRGRVRPGVMRAQMDELRWLGLDWDEGPDVGGPFAPYVQSEREAGYQAALRRLAERKLLFACRCTRRDIAAAASAPHAGDEGPRYPGRCRVRPPEDAKGAALRFRVAPGPVCFRDGLQGSVCFSPSEETGDFVVRRKDGAPAYQLAVVVDDAAMRITHVVRGNDLLASTARQILLLRALGLPEPEWIHVPLLLGPDGERLSKRHGSVGLAELRGRGIAPEAVVGWLMFSCGLADTPQPVAPTELVGRFDPRRLPRADTPCAPPWG